MATATHYRVEVPGRSALDYRSVSPVSREIGEVVRGYATPHTSCVRQIVEALNAQAYETDGSHTAGSRVLELSDVVSAVSTAGTKIGHRLATDRDEVLCDSARIVAIHTRGDCYLEGGLSGCKCGRYVTGEVEIDSIVVGSHAYRLIVGRGAGEWCVRPGETSVRVSADWGHVSVRIGRECPVKVEASKVDASRSSGFVGGKEAFASLVAAAQAAKEIS